jgi:hypothetical protein
MKDKRSRLSIITRISRPSTWHPESLVKGPHVPKVRCVESAPEFSAQRVCEDWQDSGAVLGAGRSALLKLYDMPADFPAGLDLNRIDGPENPLTS